MSSSEIHRRGERAPPLSPGILNQTGLTPDEFNKL
jgi:hypothetical protein